MRPLYHEPKSSPRAHVILSAKREGSPLAWSLQPTSGDPSAFGLRMTLTRVYAPISCAMTSRGLRKYCCGEYARKFETREVYKHAYSSTCAPKLDCSFPSLSSDPQNG